MRAGERAAGGQPGSWLVLFPGPSVAPRGLATQTMMANKRIANREYQCLYVIIYMYIILCIFTPNKPN